MAKRQKRSYRVFTFAHWRCGKLFKSWVAAYTLWADESWAGCVVYEVEASSGAEAKRKAIALRFADEMKKESGNG